MENGLIHITLINQERLNLHYTVTLQYRFLSKI